MNRILTAALCLITFSACSKGEKNVQSPTGYDFSKPVKYKMPEQLAEISGIAFYPGRKDSLYAIQDEDGKLFYWKNGHPESTGESRFGKHGDYEDLGITKNYTVILRSDGTLFIFPFGESRTDDVSSVKEWKDLLPGGEYEGLYADAEQNDVYILCKNCGADKKASSLSGYILHLDEQGQPALKGNFKVPTGNTTLLSAEQQKRLRPSALTYNKQTKEWYILSSVHKILIIADTAWNIKQVVALHSTLFPQPEGISFDIDNNLYISNEAGSTAAGTVLQFLYKKPAR